MDDTIRNTLLSHSRMQKQKNYRHLQTDRRSVGTVRTLQERAMTSLDTTLLGGQAEMISSQRG